MLKKYYLRLTIEVQEDLTKDPEVMDDFFVVFTDFHQACNIMRMLVPLLDMLKKGEECQ